MGHNQWKFGPNRAITKGTLILIAKHFFVLTSSRIAGRWLKHHTWKSLPMRRNQCLFGGNRAVRKGTVLLRPKAFLVRISSYCSGVTQTLHVAPAPHSPQPVHVWSKSGSNEGNFTLEDEHLATCFNSKQNFFKIHFNIILPSMFTSSSFT
jgi:hypothetical protein